MSKVSKSVHSKVHSLLIKKVAESVSSTCKEVQHVKNMILQQPQLSNNVAVEWIAELYSSV